MYRMRPRLKLIGKTFERLTVKSFYGLSKDHYTLWLCDCSCGKKEVIIRGRLLVTGNTKSCGCLNREKVLKRNNTHGFKSPISTDSQYRFYQIWQNMKQRCLNPNNPRWKDYGGRGIKVCKRWLKFENFRDDMWLLYLEHIKKYGEQNTSIERIFINHIYKPSNCKWATNIEQAKNKRSNISTANRIEYYKWREKLSHVMYLLMKDKIKESSLLKYFGCNSLVLRKYIESLWSKGMTWDNYGKGLNKWNIDHIVGCNNFDLSKEEDRLVCWNYKNLRPMWDIDHMKKIKIRSI